MECAVPEISIPTPKEGYCQGGGGGGAPKSQNFERKEGSKLKIPGGGGEGSSTPKKPSVGSMDIFWNHTM